MTENLERDAESRAQISELEIKVLTEVIRAVIGWLPGKCPRRSTIILDWQGYGEKAECVFRSNLGQDTFWLNDWRAERSINHVLENTTGERSRHNDSGIYTNGDQRALVVYVASGRFISSFDANYWLYKSRKLEAILISISIIMGLMRPEDSVAQASVRRILLDDPDMGYAVIESLRELLAARELPAIEIWSAGRKPNSILEDYQTPLEAKISR